jgi:hypothetical protein
LKDEVEPAITSTIRIGLSAIKGADEHSETTSGNQKWVEIISWFFLLQWSATKVVAGSKVEGAGGIVF